MTRGDFLTIRWNNRLSVILGVPTLLYILAAAWMSFWPSLHGLVGLTFFGALF